MRTSRDPKAVRQAIAFALTIAVGLVVLLVPLYSGAAVTNDGPVQVTASTLLETVGPSIVLPLLIPAALTGLPLLVRGRAGRFASIGTTVALGVFIAVASASIGWFYVPALAAAVASLSAGPENRGRRDGP